MGFLQLKKIKESLSKNYFSISAVFKEKERAGYRLFMSKSKKVFMGKKDNQEKPKVFFVKKKE